MLLVNNLPFLLTHCQRTSLINITTFVLLFNLPELIRVKPPWHNQPCVLIHWFYFYFIFTVNRVHGKGELNILLPYLAVISTAWSKALDPSSNTMWGGLGWGDLEKWGNTKRMSSLYVNWEGKNRCLLWITYEDVVLMRNCGLASVLIPSLHLLTVVMKFMLSWLIVRHLILSKILYYSDKITLHNYYLRAAVLKLCAF